MNFSKAKVGDMFCSCGAGYNSTFLVLHINLSEDSVLLLSLNRYRMRIIDASASISYDMKPLISRK